jgi:hypothetical protein
MMTAYRRIGGLGFAFLSTVVLALSTSPSAQERQTYLVLVQREQDSGGCR